MLSIELAGLLLGLAVAASAAPLQIEALDLDALGVAAQPSIAIDSRRGSFVLSWQARLDDGCTALRVSSLSSAGSLGTIHEVARGCNWFVNWADFPAVVVADNGDWLTWWLQKTGESPYAYEIRTTRSTDQGQSWSAAVVPHDDGTQTEHGFVSAAAAGADRVRLVWLDGRDMASAANDSGQASHAGHDHGHGGKMSVRSAVLDRRGLVHGSAALIDDDACSCCSTALQRMPGKETHLALFRDRSDAQIRDIRMATHRGGRWRSGDTVHDDGWKIAACPVNGPTLAVSPHGTLAAWVTMPNADELAVRVRRLDQAPGFQTLEQGSAVLGRVAASSLGDGWLVSWLGSGEQRGASRLRLRLLDSQLHTQQDLTVATISGGRTIGMPRLATLGQVSVLVWTESVAAPPAAQTGRAQTRLRGVLLESVRRSSQTATEVTPQNYNQPALRKRQYSNPHTSKQNPSIAG